MTDLMKLTDRLDLLEVKIAYQDQAIEDLNATITGQWKRIDELTRELGNLREQVKEVEASAGAPEDEQPPPHY